MPLSCFAQDMEWRNACRPFVSKYALRHSIYPFIGANHLDWKPSPYFCKVVQKVLDRLQSCLSCAFLPFVSLGGRA